MTQDRNADTKTKDSEKTASSPEKEKNKKKSEGPSTKVVLRRIPPTLTKETLLEQISPVPDHDYFHFVQGNSSMGANAFSRAYINFLNPEDIIIFRDKFDGYVFVDAKGNEYSGIVEYAPFQKIPKRKSKKDAKRGSIETDADYLKFVENLNDETPSQVQPPDVMLEQIESREKEMHGNHGCLRVSTPLIEYVIRKREERRSAMIKARESKKMRELEKRKAKEDERKKRKDKEREKYRDKRLKERDWRENEKEEENLPETPIKLLKNPDRVREVENKSPQKDVRARTERVFERSKPEDAEYTGEKSSEPRRERGGYREKRQRDQERRRNRKDDKKS